MAPAVPHPVFVPLPAKTEFLSLEVPARGIRCAEALYPAGLKLEEHAHENASITAVVDGSFEETAAGEPAVCDSGTFVLRPWGSPHADRIGRQGAWNLEIELDRSWAEGFEIGEMLRRPAVLRHPRLMEIARILRAEMRTRDTSQPLVLEGLALELLGVALRIGARRERRWPPAWLADARARLDATFRGEIRIADLAAESGVHPVHFSRAFRAHFGVAPGVYLRQLRLRWAAELLLEMPEKTVTEIALEAGFYDHSHFSRAFKSTFGTTPTLYRRQPRRIR